jgi:hypothetical protein
MRPVLPALFCASLLVVAPLAASRAQAASPTASPVSATAVITLQVDTQVDVDAHGTLTGLAFDTPLDAKLQQSLEARVRQWKFRPVSIDGVARAAHAKMRVVLAAMKSGETFAVTVDNVVFNDVTTQGAALPTTTASVRAKSLTPPRYPKNVLRYVDVVPARVLLGIRVNPDGSVAEVTPIQTALLDVGGRSGAMRDVIKEFELSSVRAAKDWTFNVAAGADDLTPSDLTVIVPIGFGGGHDEPLKPGEWRHEIRTPRLALPWLPATAQGRQVGVSDVASGEVISLESALALQTDVVGSAL